jgi:hypothetical protein
MLICSSDCRDASCILQILTIMIGIVFELSPFSLFIEGCEPCAQRSSHDVIPRRSLNTHVDTYIIPNMQRYQIHEHFEFIADLRCHNIEASKRSKQYVILAGRARLTAGVKQGMFNARKVQIRARVGMLVAVPKCIEQV